jgi:hypothetical protein
MLYVCIELHKNLFDNMLHMVQRITSYYENQSSLTDVYKGTLFSHLIDLVRFVVSLGTCLSWPAKAKMTFIVRYTTYFDQTEQDCYFSSDKPLREDT